MMSNLDEIDPATSRIEVLISAVRAEHPARTSE